MISITGYLKLNFTEGTPMPEMISAKQLREQLQDVV